MKWRRTDRGVFIRISRLCILITCLLMIMSLPWTQASAGPVGERHVLFLGDTSFGESYHAIRGVRTLTGDRRYRAPFLHYEEFLRRADVAVVNLETPLTLFLNEPKEGKTYLHWGHPVKTPQALTSRKIRVVSLANNHTMDYGMPGLEDTLKALEDNDMSWFGAGRDLQEASRPCRLSIEIGDHRQDIYIFAGFQYFRKYDRTYGFYASRKKGGVNPIDLDTLKRDIGEIREKDPSALIIYFPHWGSNYTWHNDTQRSMGHGLVDTGVDLVLGHGAHKMQEVEHYRGHWIIYGLGNFIFNSPGRYQKAQALPFSIMADLRFTERNGELKRTLLLFPILTDNYITRYQGRCLNKEEFEVFLEAVKRRYLEIPGKGTGTGIDGTGYYLSLDLDMGS